jgi:hypothetical protein
MVVEFGKSGTFLIFAGLSFTTFLFVALQVFETSGKTLEEIEAMVTTDKKSPK